LQARPFSYGTPPVTHKFFNATQSGTQQLYGLLQ